MASRRQQHDNVLQHHLFSGVTYYWVPHPVVGDQLVDHSTGTLTGKVPWGSDSLAFVVKGTIISCNETAYDRWMPDNLHEPRWTASLNGAQTHGFFTPAGERAETLPGSDLHINPECGLLWPPTPSQPAPPNRQAGPPVPISGKDVAIDNDGLVIRSYAPGKGCAL